MQLHDGVWLIVTSASTLWVIQSIVRDWDKPLKRDRWRRNKLKRKLKTQCWATWQAYIDYIQTAHRHARRGETKTHPMHPMELFMDQIAREYFPPAEPPQTWWEEYKGGWAELYAALYSCHQAYCRRLWPVDCCMHASHDSPGHIRYDSDSFQIAIDNCATSCFTNCMDDFIGKPKRISTPILGIGTATATFVGVVKWLIVDDMGRRHVLIIPGTRFQKDLPFRLLCPQHVAQATMDPNLTCLTLMDRVILVWGNGKWQRTLPLHKSSNVALMWSASSNHAFCAFAAQLGEPHIIPDDAEEEETWTTMRVSEPMESQQQINDLPTTLEAQRESPVVIDFMDEDNEQPVEEPPDVTSKQAALRKCHNRLNHMPFARIRAMAQQGLLPKYLADVEPPMCASCAYGKMTRRPWRTKGQQTSKIVSVTRSGECVSVDQMESPTPGFVGQIKGWLTTQRYRAATVFVDHSSKLTFVYMQFSTAADETVKAKKAFEAFADTHGVIIHHYHADNGRFAETQWLEAVREQGQSISFCGVGAHHQNGIAEKKIRDVQESARTMMLHAAIRWPKGHTVSLWPYAIRMAVDVMNSTPRTDDSRFSPIERFGREKVRPQLKNFHSFGCPVYVLSAPLQTQQAQSKWMSRARLGIYLGMSPRHARSVALVLNPRSGLVSPQWHVKFDDNFETVAGTSENNHGNWKKEAGFLTIQSQNPKSRKHTTKVAKTDHGRNPQRLNTMEHQPEQHQREELLPRPSEGASFEEESVLELDFGTSGLEDQGHNMEFGSSLEESSDTLSQQSDAPTLRRSSRTPKPTQRARESAEQEDIALPAAYEVLATYFEADPSLEMKDPISFLAKTDPDTMYYHQAMKADDSKQFRRAMQGEVDSHNSSQHWAIRRRDQVPEGVKVLDSVWAMRRKRQIKTKQVYKWKARLNIHGGQQEHGINYWETFAPVVTWISIRLVLILSILLMWHTRQIDFVMAYPQAPIETPLWMEVPKGVTIYGMPKDTSDYVLELKKNLYGQKQAGRVWYQHLSKGLKQLGFISSLVDECVYYRRGTMFLVYVDDGIIAGPNKEDVDQVIVDLQTLFKVSDEGELTDYLGVNVEKRHDGTIKLSQPHLIDQIIEDANFQLDTKFKTTPAASTKILNKDEGGMPHNAQWHYRGLIGKLNFLEKSTRGELGYAVHQCARFCEAPTTSHTDAVHHIVRFLIGTRDEGIILKPREQSLECYADADFCGLWNKETASEDTSTAKSRMGYLITYAGCPLVWASKLAGPICLSTTEAEYVALSSALRQVIPIMDLLEEMKAQGIVTDKHIPKVFCKAFEDNSGALEMAQTPKMRPRTKHINVAYHHFRSHVANGRITIHAISTQDQVGDLWTKPLGTDLFAKFTMMAFGWDIKTANDLAREALTKLKKAKRGSL